MKLILTTILTLLLAALAVVVISYSGLINISAVDEESGALHWLLHNTYENSVAAAAKDVTMDADLSDEALILRGAQNYQQMCSGCHTAPGEEPTVISQGLNPAAPDLNRIARNRTPEESFWVIKNGVKMSGMPALGPTHEDSELWALVAFIENMKGASAGEYAALADQAREQAPADDGHDHRHGNESMGDDHHGQSESMSESQSGEAARGHSHGPDAEPCHHDTEEEATQESQHDHDDGHDHDHGDSAQVSAAASGSIADNAQADVAAALGDALSRGDEATVRQLLDENVLIFESGGVEASMEEYAGHHMPADMAFIKAMDREVLSRRTYVDAPLAVVATRSRLTGEYRDQAVDTISTETLVLKQNTSDEWRVIHIHWSSN